MPTLRQSMHLKDKSSGIFCSLASLRPLIWLRANQPSHECVSNRLTIQKKKNTKCFWPGSFPPGSSSRIQTPSILRCHHQHMTSKISEEDWESEQLVSQMFYHLCPEGTYTTCAHTSWSEVVKWSHLEIRGLGNMMWAEQLLPETMLHYGREAWIFGGSLTIFITSTNRDTKFQMDLK